MIRFEDVHKAFGPKQVLGGFTLEIRDGETMVIIGYSGSGKSVAIKHIVGLLRPDAGEVYVDDRPVSQLDRAGLTEVRREIGFVFQFAALLDSMTVFDNVALGLRRQPIGEDELVERVQESLALVDLTGTDDKMPAELSGGMRKRVGIARAIAGKPTYLLYDEPTSGLDPVNSDVIDGLVEKLQLEIGVTSVMVTHDVRGAFRTADRIALLWQARIRAMGTAEEILQSQDPAVQQFLERDFEMQISQQQSLPTKSRASSHGTQL